MDIDFSLATFYQIFLLSQSFTEISHMSSVFIQIAIFLHHIICNSIGHPTMGKLAIKKIGVRWGEGGNWAENAGSRFFHTKLAKNIFMEVVILIFFKMFIN